MKQAEANKSENVVIAPEVKGDVSKTEVTIPAKTVEQIGSKTAASLTVSTPVANVTIPNEALSGLSESGAAVKVQAERTGNTVELSVKAGSKTVDSGKWYAEGVSWAAEKGIITGYGDGTFGPEDEITREQLAVMLWRYAGSPAAAGAELDFTDADQVSGWAQEALRWAVEKGILNGRGDGTLDPAGKATRAETAQMLMNFLQSK